jgi:hypothetical protein
MTRLLALAMLLFMTAGGGAGVTVSAQAAETYKARLGIAPVDANNQPFVTGSGTVTATLQGTKLAITGTFTGLQSPATTARIHIAPKGIRGPAALDLTATHATAGTINGQLTLTAAQVDHLKRGRLYVQLNSEKAADGNLWGWLAAAK